MNIDKKFDQKNYLTALDIFHEKKKYETFFLLPISIYISIYNHRDN